MARKYVTMTAFAATLLTLFAWWQQGSNNLTALSATTVSGAWLLLAASTVHYLLNSYWNIISRLQLRVPAIMSLSLVLLVVYNSSDIRIQAIACCEAIGWGCIIYLYYRNKRNFKKQGCGPLPRGTWINPPLQALEPGDRILTSSRVASRLHESVCHAEELLVREDGALVLFSSRTSDGVSLRPAAEELAKKMQRGHYVVQRPHEALTTELRSSAVLVADDLTRENASYKKRVNERRANWLNKLPLPKTARKGLAQLLFVRGFNQRGFFSSRDRLGCWTCISACEELRTRIGLQANKLGYGLFGRGKGFGYPLKPDLADSRFELLGVLHHSQWTAQDLSAESNPGFVL